LLQVPLLGLPEPLEMWDYWWRNTVVMWANYGEQCNDVNQQWEHQCSPLMPTHMSKEAFLAHCNATF